VTGLSCDRGATKNLPVRDQRKWAPSGAHSPWLRAGPERAAASSPQTVSAFTRALRRLTLRAATLAWTMPLPAARLISGSAALSAVEAAAWSPEAIASSTLRMKVRMRLRRDLLVAVRAAILRVAFWADGVLAISVLLIVQPDGRAPRGAAACRDEMKAAAREPPSRAVYRGKAGKRQYDSPAARAGRGRGLTAPSGTPGRRRSSGPIARSCAPRPDT